jgi:predicted ArsR family transcriptional regulator
MAQRTLRRTLTSRPRILLLDQLQRESPQTAPQLAERLDLHHNTVREHLGRLVDDGLVVRSSEHRTVRGRPRVLFSSAYGLVGVSESVRAQTCRAIALGRAFRQAFHQQEREDATDVMVEQLDVLEDHLDRGGFQPERDSSEFEIHLTCPFDDLRGTLARTLCAVDRLVIQSILARVDGPLEVSGLAPTSVKGTCILHLAPKVALSPE